MNRFGALIVGLTAGAIALSGCGAGQLAQTSMQRPGVNGTSGSTGEVVLRNAHLRVVQTTDYVRPGSDVELLLTVVNDSPDTNDRLVSITSDIGTVAVTGDSQVPANGALVVGEPDGQIAPLESAEPAETVKAVVALSKPITNGLTYNFTFRFEKAGETTIAVPISAGEQPRREATTKGE